MTKKHIVSFLLSLSLLSGCSDTETVSIPKKVEPTKETGSAIPKKDIECHKNIHYAAGDNDIDAINCQLQKKGDINAKNKEGETALHFAAKFGKFEAAKHLVENGANVTARTKIGSLPIHHAAEGGNVDIIKLLLDKEPTTLDARNNYQETPIFLAGQNDSTKAVAFFMDKRAYINATSNYGRSALVEAAGKGHLSTVNAIVQRHPNLVNYRGDMWETPLTYAVENGEDRVVEYLINNKADVNMPNKDGDRPMQVAKKLFNRSNQRVIELLEKAGAK